MVQLIEEAGNKHQIIKYLSDRLELHESAWTAKFYSIILICANAESFLQYVHIGSTWAELLKRKEVVKSLLLPSPLCVPVSWF